MMVVDVGSMAAGLAPLRRNNDAAAEAKARAILEAFRVADGAANPAYFSVKRLPQVLGALGAPGDLIEASAVTRAIQKDAVDETKGQEPVTVELVKSFFDDLSVEASQPDTLGDGTRRKAAGAMAVAAAFFGSSQLGV